MDGERVSGFEALGDRMKAYERALASGRFSMDRPVCARVDGRGFSGFTSTMRKPYDDRLGAAMVAVAERLVSETGALLAYAQSDEISLAWHVDRAARPDADVFFGGKAQKMATVLAGLASSALALAISGSEDERFRGYASLAPHFDCRVFEVPDLEEVANAFLWREADAERNAVQSAARAVRSHRDLQGVDLAGQMAAIAEAGVDFSAYPSAFRRGTWVGRTTRERTLAPEELARIPEARRPRPDAVFLRRSVGRLDMPRFRDVANRVGVLAGEAPVLREADVAA